MSAATRTSLGSASVWAYESGETGSPPGESLVTSAKQADTTFELSVPAQSAGTLVLKLETGGSIAINGWDKPQVAVRALLGGRDWRDTRVQLEPTNGGARLESDWAGRSNNRSSRHRFQISVPRKYNVRIESSGGSVSITGVDGSFTGNTGGGEIDIQQASGDVEIRTGGGGIHVADSRLNGNVSTGGGTVRIENVSGDLSGDSGGGKVIYNGKSGVAISGDKGAYVGSKDKSVTVHAGSGSSSGTTTTTYSDDGDGLGRGFARSGIRMNSGGGDIFSPGAPDGGRFTTGGGQIRIGPSGGEVYASTGGGSIVIGPSTGSVEAHTGGGDVRLELAGAGSHSVYITSGMGEVELVLPRDLNAVLELETAYTEKLGHKTRIVSAIPLQTTETTNWDRSEGTARRYVRARQTVGRGGGVIRVRTVNGNIVITRAP
jgi:hypothetical protein